VQKFTAVSASAFQKVECARYIGADKIICPVNRSVDMRLCGKVDDGFWADVIEEFLQCRFIS